MCFVRASKAEIDGARRFADLLELSLDEQAASTDFETLSPNGRPLGQGFIAMVETKLGRKVRPGKRGRKSPPGRWVDMGNSYHVPVARIQGAWIASGGLSQKSTFS